MLQLAARGVRLQKKWVARMDKRTRDTHAELNGTIIGLQERFSNGLLLSLIHIYCRMVTDT